MKANLVYSVNFDGDIDAIHSALSRYKSAMGIVKQYGRRNFPVDGLVSLDCQVEVRPNANGNILLKDVGVSIEDKLSRPTELEEGVALFVKYAGKPHYVDKHVQTIVDSVFKEATAEDTR